MSELAWVVYGSRPGYAAELAEIIERRGESIEQSVDNLDAAAVVAFALREGPARVVVGAGGAGLRQTLAREARASGRASFPPLVDPTAVVARSADIGEGTTVNALAVVAARTTLGRFVQVNRSSSVGHDVVLHDYVTMGPAVVLASSVTVHRGAFLGAGAILRPGVTVGAGAVIGAGAVVVADVAPGTLVVGNPARVVASGAAAENPALQEGW